MTDFDSELKRAFATLDDPADDGFAAAVSTRVAGAERRRNALEVGRTAAFAIAGGALALAVLSIGQAIGPQLVAQLGLDVTTAYGAVSKGAATAASLQAAFGSMLIPALLAAAAGVGGIVLARQSAD